jgi:hypothetical protein
MMETKLAENLSCQRSWLVLILLPRKEGNTAQPQKHSKQWHASIWGSTYLAGRRSKQDEEEDSLGYQCINASEDPRRF